MQVNILILHSFFWNTFLMRFLYCNAIDFVSKLRGLWIKTTYKQIKFSILDLLTVTIYQLYTYTGFFARFQAAFIVVRILDSKSLKNPLRSVSIQPRICG